ncbi:MAG: hypothetical protein JNL74_05750, partial [Fibrobacteres bacterium]|nr:hypothetical protein [Fibrobacterota bacterium]
EILEHIILSERKHPTESSTSSSSKEVRHFMLQGFYSHQSELKKLLRTYFAEQHIALISFSLDTIGWDAIIESLSYITQSVRTHKDFVLEEFEDMRNLIDSTVKEKNNQLITMMSRSEKHAENGFELILSRPNPEQYFMELKKSGFFKPEKNPVPQFYEKNGQYLVSHWNVLPYLYEMAKIVSTKDDLSFATNLLQIIQEVTNYPDNKDNLVQNYHTFEIFASIYGLLPLKYLTPTNLTQIEVWLSTPFKNDWTLQTLVDGWFWNVLRSSNETDWQDAVRFVDIITRLNWIEDSNSEKKEMKPYFMFDEYRLKELFEKHSKALGKNTGKGITSLLKKRISESCVSELSTKYSWLIRQAIEINSQNISTGGSIGILIDALRDTLSAWLTKNDNDSKIFVYELLHTNQIILRRVALNAICESWNKLNDHFIECLSEELFNDDNYRHELMRLLNSHFTNMPEENQTQIFNMILSIHFDPEGDNVDKREKTFHRNWLSKIAGKGNAAIDIKLQQLETEVGPTPENIDFNMYFGPTTYGPGPSKFSEIEMIEFIDRDILVDNLNGFKETNEWAGPTERALVETLESTVANEPFKFIEKHNQLLALKIPYQYAIISGTRRYWEGLVENQDHGLALKIWKPILEFIVKLIKSDKLWENILTAETIVASPDRNWIIGAIGDLLQAGTKKDAKGYPVELLDIGFDCIKLLLKKIKSNDEKTNDTMFQVLNDSRGKILQALLNHALRECRIEDKVSGKHEASWKKYEVVFEEELRKCTNANFEFTTLLTSHLNNLMYLNSDWLMKHVDDIFSKKYLFNFNAAFEGMAYSNCNVSIYTLLSEKGIVKQGLITEFETSHTKEHILEMIALAYVYGWNSEDLSGENYSYLLKEKRYVELLTVSRTFAKMVDWKLNQSQKFKILDFCSKVIELQSNPSPEFGQLMASFGCLSIYIESIGTREKTLFTAIIPHLSLYHNADPFLKQLVMLVDSNAEEVDSIIGFYLEHNIPDYDYRNNLLTIFKKLASKGFRKSVSIYLQKCINLNGMKELYRQIINDCVLEVDEEHE